MTRTRNKYLVSFKAYYACDSTNDDCVVEWDGKDPEVLREKVKKIAVKRYHIKPKFKDVILDDGTHTQEEYVSCGIVFLSIFKLEE